MDTAITAPASLRAVQPFVQRGSELRNKDRFMAYQCELYAAQLACRLMADDDPEREQERFVSALLDDLEGLKQQLQGHDAMADDQAASKYILQFAVKALGAAIAEEQKGHMSRLLFRKTARMFAAAGNFLEVLRMYGPLPDDLEAKVKFAKWKAADMAKQEQNLPSFSGKYPSEKSSSTDAVQQHPPQVPDSPPSDHDPARAIAHNPQVLGQAERYARQAISALLFEDVSAAICCLERALLILKDECQGSAGKAAEE